MTSPSHVTSERRNLASQSRRRGHRSQRPAGPRRRARRLGYRGRRRSTARGRPRTAHHRTPTSAPTRGWPAERPGAGRVSPLRHRVHFSRRGDGSPPSRGKPLHREGEAMAHALSPAQVARPSARNDPGGLGRTAPFPAQGHTRSSVARPPADSRSHTHTAADTRVTPQRRTPATARPRPSAPSALPSACAARARATPPPHDPRSPSSNPHCVTTPHSPGPAASRPPRARRPTHDLTTLQTHAHIHLSPPGRVPAGPTGDSCAAPPAPLPDPRACALPSETLRATAGPTPSHAQHVGGPLPRPQTAPGAPGPAPKQSHAGRTRSLSREGASAHAGPETRPLTGHRH